MKKKCSKCGNGLQDNYNYCNKCGFAKEKSTIDEMDTNKSISSIVLFGMSIIFYYLFFWFLVPSPSMLMFNLAFFSVPYFVFLIISIINSIQSIRTYKKKKELGTNIKINRKILNYINNFQFIIIILMIILFVPIFYIIKNHIMVNTKSELENLYSNNYKIVNECRYTAHYLGDSDKYGIIFKLEKENIYSFIINGDDGTKGIKKGENISLENYLDENYFSLAYIDEEEIPSLVLGIIINYNDYNLDRLENNLERIKQDFSSEYNGIQLYVYFTDDFDNRKLEYYNQFLVAKFADFECLEVEDKNLRYMSKYSGRFQK